jgi:hypothetical protein
VYQSGSSSNVFRNNYTVSGKKKYEYVLVPKKEGPHTIEQQRLYFFDPYDRTYKYSATTPLHLDVQPGNEQQGQEIVFAGGSDIEILGSDIRYIHPAPATLTIAGSGLYRNTLYIALHAIPLLGVLISLGIGARRRRWQRDASRTRSMRALRGAEKRLAAAEKLMKSGTVEQLYPEIAAAVTSYLADKMDAPPAGLTSSDMESFLAGRGVAEDLIGETNSVLHECDAARFARAATDPSAARALLDRAAELLRALEKRHLS